MGQLSKPGQNKRVVNLPRDKYDDVLSKHFSKTYPNGFHGYRGADYNNKSIFINPQKIKRVSKGTRNFYYMLMDNLPAYKDYPKRSKSIIFSNHKGDAYYYAKEVSRGKIYKIFPNNRAQIVVANSKFQYISLPYLESKLNITNAGDFDEFIVENLIKIFLLSGFPEWEKWNLKNETSDDPMKLTDDQQRFFDDLLTKTSIEFMKFPSTYFHDDERTMNFIKFVGNYISSNFDKIDFIIKFDKKFRFEQYFNRRFHPFINFLKNQDLLSALNDLFDPIKNDIKLMNVEEAYVYVTRSKNTLEMWTDGLCYLEENEIV